MKIYEVFYSMDEEDVIPLELYANNKKQAKVLAKAVEDTLYEKPKDVVIKETKSKKAKDRVEMYIRANGSEEQVLKAQVEAINRMRCNKFLEPLKEEEL